MSISDEQPNLTKGHSNQDIGDTMVSGARPKDAALKGVSKASAPDTHDTARLCFLCSDPVQATTSMLGSDFSYEILQNALRVTLLI